MMKFVPSLIPLFLVSGSSQVSIASFQLLVRFFFLGPDSGVETKKTLRLEYYQKKSTANYLHAQEFQMGNVQLWDHHVTANPKVCNNRVITLL